MAMKVDEDLCMNVAKEIMKLEYEIRNYQELQQKEESEALLSEYLKIYENNKKEEK